MGEGCGGLEVKCKCKNPNCAKEYDSREISRIYGDVPWRYKFCSASCYTQSIMKRITTNQFVLYDPMEDEVIAGPVEANNREDATKQLLDTVGYEVRIVEDKTGDKNDE